MHVFIFINSYTSVSYLVDVKFNSFLQSHFCRFEIKKSLYLKYLFDLLLSSCGLCKKTLPVVTVWESFTGKRHVSGAFKQLHIVKID